MIVQSNLVNTNTVNTNFRIIQTNAKYSIKSGSYNVVSKDDNNTNTGNKSLPSVDVRINEVLLYVYISTLGLEVSEIILTEVLTCIQQNFLTVLQQNKYTILVLLRHYA